MNRYSYIKQSRRYYWRYYRLVVAASIVMMAVLTGSLSLGDSVRSTLVRRVAERLGNTESILTSGTGFMNEEILKEPALSGAQGIFLVDGFVSLDDKLIPVFVWGTDEDSIPEGMALVNEPLLHKIGGATDLVLHLPSHNMVPSGSLFVTQSYATQIRLQIAGCKGVEQGGNILLKNEQTLPLNIFVGRKHLAEVLEMEGKCNVVLSEDVIAEETVADLWKPTYSGIHVTDSSLTYEGIFIPEEVLDDVRSACGTEAVTYFSYLVNDIIHHTDTVPYSFVTAVTQWQGEPLSGNDIILSDYAADHLHAVVGDSVRMSYFLANDLKNLETGEQMFRVKQIVPLQAFKQDKLLIADFPGLSDVEKCTDWDSDLPIQMDRIHKIDEDYWYEHHQTPKAIVSYDAVSRDWSNSFGSATAIRFADKRSGGNAASIQDKILNGLSYKPFLTVVSPRADGLFAANNGTDFASLFLALGFFIILSAILLMINPIAEMLHHRQDEITLYLQLGYSKRKVHRLFFQEIFSIVLFASPFGILTGLVYAGLTLWLLGNVWSGATHTEGFALSVQPLTLVVGWLAGLLVCALTLWYLLRKSLRRFCRPALSPTSAKGARRPATLIATITLSAITFGAIAYNFIFLHSMVLFIVCGLLWIVTFGMGLRIWMTHKAKQTTWNRKQFVWQSVYASRQRQLLAYWTLSMGVFTVFAVGLNRPDFSDKEHIKQATGGYQYYIDSRVPIQYDLNHPEVRRKLSLTDLPDSTTFLPFLRHSQDEASCLNLNRVSTPTVLGVDLQAMQDFGLELAESQYQSSGNADSGRDIPRVYIDKEALIWSLMKSVGDTLYYDTQLGPHTPVLIAGSYPTGIFHGNALMSASDFRHLWPKETGMEVLLVQSPQAEEAVELMAIAMGEYGLAIQTTEERIKMFFEVTDTYLVIFLTLGALGVLLGLFSLFIIVRKNLTANDFTIKQLCSLGFSKSVILKLLFLENIVVPFYAILIGTSGAVISISANITGAGASTILMAAACLAILCCTLFLGIKYLIIKYIKSSIV